MPTAPAAASSLDVEALDGVATVALGDTLVVLWSAPARSARIRHVTGVARRLLERTPGTMQAAQLLLPTASPPTLRERADIAEGLDLVSPRARRLVTAPLGDATWTAIVRGVMRAGVALLGKARVVKVASTPEQALDWLAETATEASPSREELTLGTAALYAALGVVAPAEPRTRARPGG